MRRTILYLAVSSSLFLAYMAMTAVSVAFPVLKTDLGSSLVASGWVLSVYQLINIIAMPVAARLSDGLGRRFTFISCLVLFSGGSTLCALAPNTGSLILFRVIQGLGAGGILPAATAIISDEYPGSRYRAIGLLSSVMTLGTIVGPNLGGWMVSELGWRSIFWLNLPLGIIDLIGALWLVRTDAARKKMRMDLVGASLLVGAVSSLMLALTLLEDTSSVPLAASVLLGALSPIIFWLFIRHEKRTESPIIDLEMLVKRPFRETNVYNFFFGSAAVGIFSIFPLYATSVYGMDVLLTGVVLTPRTVGMMLTAFITALMLMRWGYRRPILVGTLMVIGSFFLLALNLPGVNFLGIDVSPFVLVSCLFFLSGLGAGFCVPAANNACIELMPEKVATLTSLRGVFRQTAAAIAVTVSTLVLQTAGDMARGFTIVFIGTAVLLLLAIPTIFVMPPGPRVSNSTSALRQ